MKISILLPTYKTKFLKECIDSILAQTYKDFELIVVNDASPYDVDSVIKAYSDSRIRYYKNQKGYGAEHLVDNWNHCLEYAIGDYVMCMGDDDKLISTCLEKYVDFIKKHPGLNVYHARTIYIDENSKEKKVQAIRPVTETVYSSIWHRVNGYYRFCIGEYLFDTMQLRKKGGFFNTPMAWAADDLSVWNVSIDSYIGNLAIPGFMYRENSFAISNNGSGSRSKLQALLIMKEWINKIEGTKPSADLDNFYLERIHSSKKRYISRFCKTMVSDDIILRPVSGIRYWIRHKRIDNDIVLKNKEILKSCYIALKRLIIIPFLKMK